MNAAVPRGEIAARLNLGNMPAREAFLAALELYRQDPLFCIPDRARDVVGRLGDKTAFVILGTKDFGASFVTSLGTKGRAVYVVDDFKCHRGERFHGVDIISTDKFIELCSRDPDIVALNSCRYDYSRRFFENLCRDHSVPCLNFEEAVRLIGLTDTIDYRLADWGPTILARASEFAALEQRLADPYSAETLHSVLTFHLTCNPEWHLNVSRPYPSLYFRSGLFSFTDTEKFVDCGASIGESTSGLIGVTQGRFKHSWMIEPDRFNVETLKKFQRKYARSDIEKKLSLHPVAVGESVAEVPFRHQGGHGGSVAVSSDGTLESVNMQPIDNIIDDAPTFIKMDIEGFELPALRGSVKAIQASEPKLAISAYHRATDLLDLPNYIDEIAPGYTIGLRHHTEDRWDTCLYFYR